VLPSERSDEVLIEPWLISMRRMFERSKLDPSQVTLWLPVLPVDLPSSQVLLP
jgi:hypothetical protein